ncbi:cell division ATP-binding protein FtsE [Parvibium lacunae]|uniref:Cell division ATP-binding protein FtsE n=1 Tax=Parvibium lacunae TaxID=1888893 RepID=A0A368L096_9BURK|nr:ATP-binding cassette domain-containing protein [Parvibium lacunae]RCS56990.1 ATP-binding cassette domain-containing protein [Parvibium lacunae]
MIEFKHVSKTFTDNRRHTQTALHDVSFQIDKGELVFLTGHSGAGKSTLLSLIAGLEQPTQGSLLIQGTDISRLPRQALPYLRRHVGVVFQEQKLLADRSLLENVRLPLLVTGHSLTEANTRARAALDKVGLLAREQLKPAALSGGDQQRVAIARALVNRPAILLADEPTANLDRDTAIHVIEVLRDFVRVGVTAIIATHDEFLLSRFPTRILTLAQGRLATDRPGPVASAPLRGHA